MMKNLLSRRTSGELHVTGLSKTTRISKTKVNSNSTYAIVEERIEDESGLKIKRLEMMLNELKSDHYSLVRENKEQSEKLNKELQNSINA